MYNMEFGAKSSESLDSSSDKKKTTEKGRNRWFNSKAVEAEINTNANYTQPQERIPEESIFRKLKRDRVNGSKVEKRTGFLRKY